MAKTDRAIFSNAVQAKNSAPARVHDLAGAAKALTRNAGEPMPRPQAVWREARRGSSWVSYVSRHRGVARSNNDAGMTGGSQRAGAIPDITSNIEREAVYFVYILANKPNGTLYCGVTDNLIRRVQQHREGLVAGFSKRYAMQRLVYFETLTDINAAILREKCIKRWRRQWKVELIEAKNPQWRDLWLGLISKDQ